MRRMPLDRWRQAARGLLLLLFGWAILRPRLVPGAHPGTEAGPDLPVPPPRLSIRALSVMAAALLVLIGLGSSAAYWMARQERVEVAKALTGGDPARAPALLLRYGCGGCHAIPGLAGADGRVAAPLTAMRERVYVGGVLRNTPDNLVRWIVDPRAISPRTAMPATGITEAEARDVAAYLYAR
jgi:cytochrome c1